QDRLRRFRLAVVRVRRHREACQPAAIHVVQPVECRIGKAQEKDWGGGVQLLQTGQVQRITVEAGVYHPVPKCVEVLAGRDAEHLDLVQADLGRLEDALVETTRECRRRVQIDLPTANVLELADAAVGASEKVDDAAGMNEQRTELCKYLLARHLFELAAAFIGSIKVEQIGHSHIDPLSGDEAQIL